MTFRLQIIYNLLLLQKFLSEYDRNSCLCKVFFIHIAKIYFVLIIALKFLLSVWAICFHCTSTNKAAMEMGIYVIINSGNVNRYITFLCRGAYILFHWVSRVTTPMARNMVYILYSHTAIPRPMTSSRRPVMTDIKQAVPLTSTLTKASKAAGIRFIIMS